MLPSRNSFANFVLVVTSWNRHQTSVSEALLSWKKKKQEKRFSDSVIKSNTVLSNEQNIAQHIPITESDNTNEQISFTLPSNVEKTNVCNSNRNVLDDFLTWTVVPNNQTESNNNNNDNTTANVRRSVPYKVPTTRRNI